MAEAPDFESARAEYAIRRALSFGAWVHRRAETFVFSDAHTVRRHMSVDFSLPRDSEDLDGAEFVYVPVMIPVKADLRNFDIVDATGDSQTVLNTSQNAAVATLGLSLLLLDPWPDDVPEPAEVIEPIVKEPEVSKALRGAQSALADKGPIGRALDNLNDKDHADLIRALVRELARGFLLLTPVPYRPGERQLIKFNYDARLARQGTMLRRLGQFGMAPIVEEFEGLAVGWGQSYHVEVVPPPDTYVADVGLKVANRKPIDDDHAYRPHLRAVPKRRGDKGQLSLLFQAQREVLILPLFLAALAITGTLTWVPQNAENLNADALSALLLVPLALVAYYARSSENSYVRQVMRGVRAMAFVPALVGVVVLALIAVGELGTKGDPSNCAVKAAEWAARLAVPPTVFLAIALLSPPFFRGERGVRSAQDRATKDKKGLRRTLLETSGVLVVAGVILTVVSYFILPI